MSKTIDERIVSLKFDNQQFENGTKTSMSTLDKLKEKLNFTGATKGLDDIGNATKRIDMNGLGGSVESVRLKFSALEIMGVTALTNITNSAINAGKQILSSLTIEPIKTGFNEYELKMGSVQTIMASTGASIEEVNKYLNELNAYSDKTIYSFSDMTSNIGKFTNAGVKLEDAVLAIKGVSNEAAVSGANANEASRAMYNFAQALSAGFVKLIDWKSIENANMATVEFKNELIKSAVAAGTLQKNAQGMYDVLTTNASGSTMKYAIDATHNFNDSLNYQWMTTEVLVSTLKNYADETTEIGKKAYASAQDVKTFTMMLDTLKEAAQSGWAQTWEIIVGDFNEAKTLWTNAAKYIGNIIDSAAKARNDLLGGALGSGWSTFSEKLSEAGVSVEDFQTKLESASDSAGKSIKTIIEEEGSLAAAFEHGRISGDLVIDALKSLAGATDEASGATQEITGKLENLKGIVDQVLIGSFGNGEERIRRLTEAGYDYAAVQELVNKVCWGQEVSFENLSDAQLESIGYTQEQISTIRNLAEEAEKSGSSINDLIRQLERPSGRFLLIDSIKNIVKAVQDVITPIKEAWSETFELTSDMIYNVIEKFNAFTKTLKVDSEMADNLKRTFKGLFAVLDVIREIVGGALNSAFQVFKSLIGESNLDVLGFSASIGDALSSVRDWLKENNRLKSVFDTITSVLTTVISKVREFVNAFIKLPVVQNAFTTLKENAAVAFENIGLFLDGAGEKIVTFLNDMKPINEISFDGILTALSNFKDMVFGHVDGVIGKFDGMTISFTDIKDRITGFVESVSTAISDFFGKIKEFASSATNFLGDHFGETMTVLFGSGFLAILLRISSVISKLVAPIENLTTIVGKLLSSVTGVFKGLRDKLKAEALETKSKALLNFALAVAILAGSIALLASIDSNRLVSATDAIAQIAIAITAFTVAMQFIGKNNVEGSVTKVSIGAMLIGLAGSILILVVALKKMEDLDQELIKKNLLYLGIMLVGMATIVGVLGRLTPQLSKGSLTFLAMAGALKIMVDALVDMNDIDADAAQKNIKIMLEIVVLLALLSVASGNLSIGKALGMIAVVVALQLFVNTFKSLAELDVANTISSIRILEKILESFAIIIAATSIAGKNSLKAGTAILEISLALLIVIEAIRQISDIESEELSSALLVIESIMEIFTMVMALSSLAGQNAAKAGAMFLMMSAALIILTGSVVVLSHIEEDGLERAVKAITVLGLMFGAILALSGLAKECKSTLILISVAIGILTIALGAMSFIEPERLVTASLALSAIMAMFALIVASTNLAQKATGTIILMTVVVAALAGIIYLLSSIPFESALGAAASLSILLLSLSVSIAIIGAIHNVSGSALASVALLTIVLIAMAEILKGLASMNPEAMIPIAESLSILLISLSACCVVLGVAGTMGAAGLVGIGVLAALIASVGVIMVALGALVSYIPQVEEFLDKGLVILEKIGYGLGAFAGSIIGGLGAGIASGLPAIADSLSDFMNRLSVFISGAKQIDADAIAGVANIAAIILLITAADVVDRLTSWLTGGKDQAIADFASGLVPLGEALAEYGKSISGISDATIGKITKASEATKIIASMIGDLPTNGGVAGLILGENSLSTFAEELAEYGPKLIAYSESISTFDNAKLNAIKRSADATLALAEMAKAIPKEEGLLQLIVGENNLASFAEGLAAYGPKLMAYSESVSTFDNAKLEAVKRSSDATLALTDVANKLPKEGGWLQAIIGDNSLASFGAELAAYGPKLISYSANVTGFNDDKLNAVKKSADATLALTEVAGKLPREGGWIQAIIGDNSLSSFGAELAAYGPNLTSYANSILGFSSSKLATVERSSDATLKMAEMAKKLPSNRAEWLSKIVGDKGSLSSFGEELAKYGPNLSKYATSLSGFDEGQLTSIELAVTATEVLVKMVKDIPTQRADWIAKIIGDDGLVGFAENLVVYSEKLKLYSDKIASIDMVQLEAATAVTSNLIAIAKDMSEIDTSGMKKFGTNLEALANDGIEKFIQAFEDADTKVKAAAEAFIDKFLAGAEQKKESVKTKFSEVVDAALKAITDKSESFKTEGKNLIQKMIDGAKSMSSSVTSAMNEIVTSASTTLRNGYSSMYEAGRYCVQGFANGVSSNTYLATSKVQTLATSTANTARAKLQVKSPSRVFYKIGTNVVEGFANAIFDGTTSANKAISNLSEQTRIGMTNSISKLAALVENGIEANPVIRPVMDLSEIQNGTNQMSSIFNRFDGFGVSGSYRVAMQAQSSIGGIMASRSESLINQSIDGLKRSVDGLAQKPSGEIKNVFYITGNNSEDIANQVSRTIQHQVERRNATWGS